MASYNQRDFWMECAKRGIGEDPLIKTALQQLSMNPQDINCQQLITSLIHKYDVRELLHPEPFRRSNPGNRYTVSGSIRMGLVNHTGIEWGISPDMLTKMMCVVGRTGGGKTTVIKAIIRELLKQHKASIIVPDRKQDFFDIAFEFKFLYFLLKDFKDNWCAPPEGVLLRLWFNILAEILTTAFELRIAAHGLLVDTLVELTKKAAKSSSHFPTLRDVTQRLFEISNSAKGATKEQALRIGHRISSLLSIVGDAAASRQGLEWSKLSNRDWALSLAGLASSLQSLIITIYFAKCLLYRICNNLRSDKLETLFVLDEASMIFPKTGNKKTSILLDYFQQARAFGIGVIFASQSMNLANEIFANTATKIAVGGFGHGGDYEAFASAVGLNRAQRDFMRTITAPGSAVVKDLRHPYPFTVQIDRGSS
ncbi:MAG: ATP-binding protein [candidate division Zixibacteria bacterium]|nr:ATP-binding protein [candidate division Zixibacteria bacterium]